MPCLRFYLFLRRVFLETIEINSCEGKYREIKPAIYEELLKVVKYDEE